MDRLPGFIVMALFGVILQPPITEVGISGGPYWPEIGDRETFRRAAIGITAHTALNQYFGVQFGGGYKQGGVERCVARPKDETTLTALRQAPIGATPPCVLPDMLETHEAETVHRLYDYIDFSMLGQARILAGDRIDVRLVLGPTVGHSGQMPKEKRLAWGGAGLLDGEPRHRLATRHRHRGGDSGVAQPRLVSRLSVRRRHKGPDRLRAGSLVGHRVVAHRRGALPDRELNGGQPPESADRLDDPEV